MVSNKIGYSTLNVEILSNGLKKLLALKKLDLEFSYNSLQESPDNIMFLSESIGKITTLRELILGFSEN